MSNRRSGPAERRIDVVGFGAMNLDRIVLVRDLDRLDSEMAPAAEMSSGGGSAANTIVGLARLGRNTAYIGAVGDDHAGDMMLQELEQEAVDTSFVVRHSGTVSGEAVCISDRRGRRLIVVDPGANDTLSWKEMDHIRKRVISSRPQWVHFTGFQSQTLLAMQAEFAEALRVSIPTIGISCAPGALYVRRGFEELRLLLQACSFLILNGSELSTLTALPETDYEAAAQLLLAELPRCELLAVTFGSGIRASQSKDGMEQLEWPEVSVTRVGQPRSIVLTRSGLVALSPVGPQAPPPVDTLGAGDAYAAGFIEGLLQGRSATDCARAGDTVAGCVIKERGARVGLPDRSTFMALRSHARG